MTEKVLINKLTKKCLTREGGDISSWVGFRVNDCDINNTEQKVTFGKAISFADRDVIRVGKDKHYLIITPQRLADGQPPIDVRADMNETNTGGLGKSGDIRYYNLNGDVMNDSITNEGPFLFGSKYHNSKRVHVQTEDSNVIRHFDPEQGEGKDKQTWLDYGLWKKCETRGVDFDNCTKTKLNDCSDTRNHTDYDTCPEQFCTKPENSKDPRCITWCQNNTGKCDVSVAAYCETSDGMKDEFCSCYGAFPETAYSKAAKSQGVILRKECNLPACVSGGTGKVYKSQNMLKQICPSQNICIAGLIDNENVGGDLQLTNITSNCNQVINGETVGGPGEDEQEEGDLEEGDLEEGEGDLEEGEGDLEEGDLELSEESLGYVAKIAGLDPKAFYIILGVIAALFILFILLR